MALFRKGPSPHQTALAMIGARPGTRVLVVGTPPPGIVAALAAVTGLNGQTLLAIAPDARDPYEKAAAEEGVLLETLDAPADPVAFPPTPGSHDIVVIQRDLALIEEALRQPLVEAAFGALRPGGRVVIIEGRPATGWFARRTPTLAADLAIALLEAAGGLAARQLGAADGVWYFEARKGQ